MSEPGAPPAKTSGLVWFGRIAAAGMVVMVLGIVGFIVRTEYAHDVARCPYRQGELRRIDEGVSVQEQWRRCQEGEEERRWMILRQGEPPREFARRRMDRQYFQPDAYTWDVRADSRGELVLEVHNGDAPPIEVLEAKLLVQ